MRVHPAHRLLLGSGESTPDPHVTRPSSGSGGSTLDAQVILEAGYEYANHSEYASSRRGGTVKRARERMELRFSGKDLPLQEK